MLTLFHLALALLPLISARGLFEPSGTSIKRSSLDRRVVVAANVDICEKLGLTVPFTTTQTCVSNADISVSGIVAVKAKSVCTSVVTLNILAGSSVCTTANVPVQVVVLGQTVTVQVATTTCTTITTNNIQVSAGVCLCTNNKALTQASLDSISAAVRANAQVTTALGNVGANGGVTLTTDSVIDYLNAAELSILVTDGTANKCKYPQGAIPNCSGTCTYDCPAETSVCNNVCSTTCVSGVPARRAFIRGAADFRCGNGFAACAISATRLTPASQFECIDTERDIESCGGCAFPLDLHGRIGQDCTAIPNATGVECRSGACVVESCKRGFEVSGNACVAKRLVVQVK